MKATVALVMFSLLFIFFLIYRARIPAQLMFDEDRLNFSGAYGKSIPLEKIREISIVTHMPTGLTRLHGYNMGRIRKGVFRDSNGKKYRLILESYKAPVLQVITEDDHVIFFNSDYLDDESLSLIIDTILKNK